MFNWTFYTQTSAFCWIWLFCGTRRRNEGNALGIHISSLSLRSQYFQCLPQTQFHCQFWLTERKKKIVLPSTLHQVFAVGMCNLPLLLTQTWSPKHVEMCKWRRDGFAEIILSLSSEAWVLARVSDFWTNSHVTVSMYSRIRAIYERRHCR